MGHSQTSGGQATTGALPPWAPLGLLVAGLAALVALSPASASASPVFAKAALDADGWRAARGPHGFDLSVSGEVGYPLLGGVQVLLGVPLTGATWWTSELSVLLDMAVGLQSRDRGAPGAVDIPILFGPRAQVWHTRWFGPFVALRAGPAPLLDPNPYSRNALQGAVEAEFGLVFMVSPRVGVRATGSTQVRFGGYSAEFQGKGRFGVLVVL